MDRILSWRLQFVLLGSGDAGGGAAASARSAAAIRTRFRAWHHFDNGLAHRIYAGSDFVVVPSRFEPCGLTQLYGLRYGTLPIVRATGGLVDTVRSYREDDGHGTGFVFRDLTPDALADTIGWALSTWYDRPGHFAAMRRHAMQQDFTWGPPAEEYERLYRDAYRRRRGHELAASGGARAPRAREAQGNP